MPIRNPIEWAVDQAAINLAGVPPDVDTAPIRIARIGVPDLRVALAKGWADFVANRTDVILLCVFYPVIGLVLGRFASGEDTLPLLFPLAAGFALLGPVAATGLYEISRKRALGEATSWMDAFGVLRRPTIASIVLLGVLFCAIFMLWLLSAAGIYAVTLGPAHPASLSAFVRDVLGTTPGHVMIAAGMAAGFVFALAVLGLGVVSFPLLIDRNVSLEAAILASARATAANPVPIAAWGLIVASALCLASIPLFVGLVVVLPVLGHATWHLYRRLIPV